MINTDNSFYLKSSAVVVIVSLSLSLFFTFGQIDQDYFSFYYIGTGMLKGLNIYKDFADNKGPVLYLFFSALSLLFKSNYQIALVIASTVLDYVAVFFTLLIFVQWSNKISPKYSNLKWYVSIIVITALYKCFSIGAFMGGIYSETLGMALVTPSIYLVEVSVKNSLSHNKHAQEKIFYSGMLFALAFLSRQTIFVFGVYFIYKILKSNNAFRNLIYFVSGSVLISFSFFVFLFTQDSVRDAFESIVLFNFSYAAAVSEYKLPSMLAAIYTHPAILISLLIPVYVFIMMKIGTFKPNRDLFVLALVSSLSIAGGGLFYFHHFLQFVPVILISLLVILKEGGRSWSVWNTLIIFLIVLNFVAFSKTRNKNFKQVMQNSEISNHLGQHEYIMVVPYYPQVYVDFKKQSPDRYYQPFFTSEFFNNDTERDKNRHKSLSAETLSKTLFIFISNNDFDKLIVKEYVDEFSDRFSLSNVGRYQIDNINVVLYKSYAK